MLALPNSVLPLSSSALAAIFVANRVSLPFFDANLATRNMGGIPAITFSDSAIDPATRVFGARKPPILRRCSAMFIDFLSIFIRFSIDVHRFSRWKGA